MAHSVAACNINQSLTRCLSRKGLSLLVRIRATKASWPISTPTLNMSSASGMSSRRSPSAVKPPNVAAFYGR
jgi:hypothetical protein